MGAGPYADSSCTKPRITEIIGRDRRGMAKATKFDGTFAFSGDAITVDTPDNDWNPDTDRTTMYLTAASAQTVHGLINDAFAGDGQHIVLINVGTFDITFLEDSVSSATAKYRFIQGFVLAANSTATLYRTDSQRWAVLTGGAGGGGTTELVPHSAFNQVGHGLTVGTPVLFDGINYDPATADPAANVAVMLVSEITDVDNVKVANDGKLTLTDVEWKAINDGGDSLGVGNKYYLSQTVAGKITSVKPTSGIVQYIGYAESVTVMQLDIEEEPQNLLTGMRHTIASGETLAIAANEFYPVPQVFTVDAAGVVQVDAGGVLEAMN